MSDPSGLNWITEKDANVKIIEQALEQVLQEKPLCFFTNIIIMPLLPREARAAVEAGDRVVEGQSHSIAETVSALCDRNHRRIKYKDP